MNLDPLARTVALALAVWSHGPKEGAPADRCFPARADHFLRWIRTGANPKPEPEPELARLRDVAAAAHRLRNNHDLIIDDVDAHARSITAAETALWETLTHLPGLNRWCADCGAAEHCHWPGGSRYGPGHHPFNPGF